MPLLTPGPWAFFAMAVAVPIAIVAAGRWRWHVRTRALTARLAATREPPRPARVDARALDGLPPVVQRYFRAALPEGARRITCPIWLTSNSPALSRVWRCSPITPIGYCTGIS